MAQAGLANNYGWTNAERDLWIYDAETRRMQQQIELMHRHAEMAAEQERQRVLQLNTRSMITTAREACGRKCMANPKELCVASNCMGWRWTEIATVADMRTGEEQPNLERKGYCGAAGQPEM